MSREGDCYDNAVSESCTSTPKAGGCPAAVDTVPEEAHYGHEGAMAADAFSWLHLTDLHFGLRGQRHLWPNLRGPFLDDLAALHDRCGPWDAVFFTGDLTQQGEADEFAKMQTEVLDRVWEKLTELGSGDAVLLAVPGNHDLCRPKAADPAARWLIKSFDEIAEEFWEKPAGPYGKVITDAFAAYTEWWQGAPRRPAELTPGLLPGDFAVTLNVGRHKIGVVGLNTAFLQLAGGDYTERLVWNARQLDAVCGGAADDWTKKHDLCLLLTHHGPDWLTPDARKHGDTEIAPPGRFALHLYGHMHATELQTLHRGGDPRAVRRWQGVSLFSMEHYGVKRELQRAHGFTAGRVDFGGEHPTARCWPRRATDKPTGWRLIPDPAAVLADDGATHPETLHRTLPHRATAPATAPAIAPAPAPPAPATGPRSNLPRPAPFFGRSDALEKIARWLDPGDRSWGVHIDGPGGIGKSALALEAAHRAPAEHYPLKLWVTAKTRELHPEGERKLEGSHPGDFTAILDAFARALDRGDLPRLTPEDRPAALHAALAAHRALLVVDNLEALAPAERRRVLDWLNRLPQSCRALVTSRRRDDSLAGHALQVDKLDRAAADQLLAALGERQPPVARLTAGERERLYTETGGNPLLLTWIAAQLGRTTGRCRTVDDALARLHDAHHRAHEPGNDPLAYVFGDLVESFTADETKVLAALAHFTRPAPVVWLLPMTGLGRLAAETALDGLRDRALLVEDEAAGTWRLPPLAAGYLRRARPEAVGQVGTRLADEVYALVQENGRDHHDRFPVLDAAWPRVEAALQVLLTGDNRRLQAVCDALGMFFDFTGRLDEQLALSEAAEARALAAADPYNAGWRAFDVGWCHFRRGEAALLLAAAERAADHWRAAGDPARERALAIRLRALGHELAGEHAAALAAYEEVLALDRARDPISDDVARALNDVGTILRRLGRHDEAEARYQEALTLARRLDNAEGVAIYTTNLADLAVARGRPAEAEALARKALALAEPLGRRDLIATCCTILALALAAQGRGAEGRPYAERAVNILTALRAPDLPEAQAALAACAAPPASPRPG